MNRINVYRYPSQDDLASGYNDKATVEGFFDLDKATEYREDTFWNGNNHASVHTGSPHNHQMLYHTAGGRWVLHTYSNYQGVQPTYEFIDDNAARTWLITNNDHDLVGQLFGDLPDEAGPGPGRPAIGGEVKIMLGDLLPAVDAWAAEQQISRAEAIRRLVAQALPQPATTTAGAL